MNWTLRDAGTLLRALLLFVALLAASAAEGFEVNGYMEFDYSKSKTLTRDRTGTEQRVESTDFLQRYSFTLRQELLPTLSLNVGYILDRDLQRAHSGEASTQAVFVRKSPSVSLAVKNPFFLASVGYDENTAKASMRGSPAQTMNQDKVSANVALARREDLPTLNIYYDRSHAYDKERVLSDTITEQLFLNTRYQVIKPLEARYSFNYTDTMDNHGGVEATNMLQSGRLAYSDSFLKSRVRVYSNYDVTFLKNQSRTSPTASGEVTQPLFPFAGLSGAGPLGTDTLSETPALDTLVVNAQLIDGALTAGSGINIGYSALVPEPRNMGLDLGTATEVNSLYVWVSQMLPASIAGTFSWDIYISADTTDRKTWTLWQTVAPAAFGVFDARFELRFAKVRTRFIKVVTRPLASPVPVPGVDVNNILVSELQAFLVTAVQDLPRETTDRSGTQRFEAGANVKLAEVPNLYYDVYYWQTRSSPLGLSRNTLVNSITLSRRFSTVFATNAMASRSDSHESDGLHHIAEDYSIALTATPLNTLNHTLRLGRRMAEVEGKKDTSDSWFLGTNAALYKGISANLSLSQDRGALNTGDRTKNTSVSAGATLMPKRSMTINLYHNTANYQVLSGPSLGTDFSTENNGASVSYSPYETLYLYASYVAGQRKYAMTNTTSTSRTQNYSLNWSPLLSGDIWFTIAADQTVTSANDETRSTITPAIRWSMVTHASLEGGYQFLSTRNVLLVSRTDTIFTTLRVTF